MKSLPVDRVHVLEDLLGMYHIQDPEVLVCEALANAVDVFLDNKIKNPKIEITLEKIDENTGYINFHNNGTPMTKAQFEKYHTIASQSKEKGRGIGFAGIGAKVFLASKLGGEIFTISGENDKKFFASRMLKTEKDVAYGPITDLSEIFDGSKCQHKYGTTYRVRINNYGYKYFKDRLSAIVQFWWNYAILKKQFTVTVNGKKVEAFDPQDRFNQSFTWKKTKIDCFCWITKPGHEIPEERQHIVYAVHGKRITKEFLRTPVNWKEDYSHRVFCLANVTHLAGYIKPDKESFEGNWNTNGTRQQTEKFFIEFLNKHGLLGKDISKPQTAEIVNEMTKQLDKLLTDADFKDLNPFLSPRKRMVPTADENGDIPVTEIEGEGPVGGDETIDGGGDGTDAGHGEGKSVVEDKEGADPGKRKERKAKGIRIIPTEEYPDEEQEAWVDAPLGAICINILHPFYQTMRESDKFGKFEKFNVNRVLIEALIRHKSDELDWNPKKVLDKYRDLLHRTWRG